MKPSNSSEAITALSSIRPASGYAGDITVQQAFAWINDSSGVLVDVRTDAEREWVGIVPGALALPLKQWPGMQVSADFDECLKQLPAGKKLLMLCRSGIRSIAAARRAAALGLEAYNVLEGFEGDPDINGQRGRTGGWRFHGLPWKQL